MKSDEFVYLCPFCAEQTRQPSAVWSNHVQTLLIGLTLQPQLVLRQQSLRDKYSIWFRYDPPVLVVAITWHQTAKGLGELIHSRLALSYASDPGAVGSPGSRITFVF
jgi:hypothetical protein